MSAMFPKPGPQQVDPQLNAVSTLYTEHMGNTLTDADLYRLRHQAGVDVALVNRILSAGYVLGPKETTFIVPAEVMSRQMPTGAGFGDWLRQVIRDLQPEPRHHHHHHHHHEPFPVPGGGSVTGGGWR